MNQIIAGPGELYLGTGTPELPSWNAELPLYSGRSERHGWGDSGYGFDFAALTRLGTRPPLLTVGIVVPSMGSGEYSATDLEGERTFWHTGENTSAPLTTALLFRGWHPDHTSFPIQARVCGLRYHGARGSYRKEYHAHHYAVSFFVEEAEGDGWFQVSVPEGMDADHPEWSDYAAAADHSLHRAQGFLTALDGLDPEDWAADVYGLRAIVLIEKTARAFARCG